MYITQEPRRRRGRAAGSDADVLERARAPRRLCTPFKLWRLQSFNVGITVRSWRAIRLSLAEVKGLMKSR
jgi:hypothetical protein